MCWPSLCPPHMCMCVYVCVPVSWTEVVLGYCYGSEHGGAAKLKTGTWTDLTNLGHAVYNIKKQIKSAREQTLGARYIYTKAH